MLRSDCPFCRPEVQTEALWTGEHYLVLADAFPGCTGHVLLVTREHLPSQMHAPESWMHEFEAAHDLIRRFLKDWFGAAGFWENGGARQQVEHAHLHGLPFAAEISPDWKERGWLREIQGWQQVRQECERSGSYTYLETPSNRYLVSAYDEVLERVRPQLVEQSDALDELRTNPRARSGTEAVAETIKRWQRWSELR